MEKWWQESEPEKQEPEYIPITKMVPQVTHDTVYETIHDQVIQYVPQYIYKTITETEYVDIYHDVIKEVPVYIYETVVEKETVYVPEIQTVYETITETVPPSEDDIKQYIKDHSDEIITIIKEMPEFETIVQEYIRDHFDEVLKIINDSPDKEEIIEKIIQSIPPDEITKYLTTDQIKYILEQQPPQVILQTLKIIDIEYIIFAGNAESYNGPPGVGGSTPLTTQAKSSNDASVAAIAKALQDNPAYLIMLHGHANPTEFSDSETEVLKKLSMDRAKAVEAELRTQFKKLSGGVDIDDSRVSVSGYGGEKVLFGNNSANTDLNRRVEMILVWVGVQQ
jgi:glutaredoxin-related protein